MSTNERQLQAEATWSTTMRLLLVEDDEMIAEPVLDALRREGYAVDWAKDGR